MNCLAVLYDGHPAGEKAWTALKRFFRHIRDDTEDHKTLLLQCLDVCLTVEAIMGMRRDNPIEIGKSAQRVVRVLRFLLLVRDKMLATRMARGRGDIREAVFMQRLKKFQLNHLKTCLKAANQYLITIHGRGNSRAEPEN